MGAVKKNKRRSLFCWLGFHRFQGAPTSARCTRCDKLMLPPWPSPRPRDDDDDDRESFRADVADSEEVYAAAMKEADKAWMRCTLASYGVDENVIQKADEVLDVILGRGDALH